MDKISIEIISRVARAFLMVLCVYLRANCMQDARFKPIHVTVAELSPFSVLNVIPKYSMTKKLSHFLG